MKQKISPNQYNLFVFQKVRTEKKLASKTRYYYKNTAWKLKKNLFFGKIPLSRKQTLHILTTRITHTIRKHAWEWADSLLDTLALIDTVKI